MLSKAGLVRLNADGTLDNTFDIGNGFAINVPYTTIRIYSILVQPNEKIVIGGYFSSFNGVPQNNIVRLNPNGTLDNTFKTGLGFEEHIDPLYTYSARVKVMSQQFDGRIIVGGRFHLYNGIKRGNIVRLLNCDSPSTGVDSVYACNSYTWIDGKKYTTTNNSATYIIQNGAHNGCDSIVTLSLIIKNFTSSSVSVNTCNQYTAPDGQILKSTGIYKVTIPNSVGCDSIITINLTVNTNDKNVTNNVNVLTANQSGAIYQWLDCNNNYEIIPNEKNQVFKPSNNGKYAVVLKMNDCIDTSSCYSVVSVGINDHINEASFILYPNPAKNNFTISDLPIGSLVNLLDIYGKIIFSTKSNKNNLSINVAQLANGTYFVQTITNAQTSVAKLIIDK